MKAIYKILIVLCLLSTLFILTVDNPDGYGVANANENAADGGGGDPTEGNETDG